MSNESDHYAREKAFWDERGDEAYVSLSKPDLERLRAWVGWDGKGLCLDLGAGSGMGARVLGPARDGGAVVGVDISHRLLRHAPGSAVQGDALRLPFRDASFDVVIAAALFHHLPGREPELLAECARVLVPGGRLVGYDPSADCLQNRVFMGDSRMRLGTFSPDERPIRPAVLANVAEGAGFAGFRFERITFRNARMTPFEFVQRYLLEPVAFGPLAPLLKRWFLWEARRA
ncbi:MAG TPA: methyltransferase domain-containing protein [Xanthomonadales bacterium]|nr:methyltransferase domain-containing protein [Xanthomonadales bacterium]